MTERLEDLVVESIKNGWAVGRGAIDEVRQAGRRLGYTEVPIRRGGPSVAVLTPTDSDQAATSSLSAIYGRGEQSLHTDGAHLSVPPDIVVLVNETPSATP